MSKPGREDSLAWFREARFGIFIHWGCYSVTGRCEQIMARELMPLAECDALAKRFDPPVGWAESLMKKVAASGAKYAVLTTRHHDGYALWDSPSNAFNAARIGPKRDLIAEYVEAARAVGLKVGFYYSPLNWRWKCVWDPQSYANDLPAYVGMIHTEVRELMTGYGDIDIFWWDVDSVPGEPSPGAFGYCGQSIGQSREEFYRAPAINAEIRRLQPGILINDRLGTPEDFSTPEQVIEPDADPDRAWETCMTLNPPPGWSYLGEGLANKSPGELIYYLVNTVRQGGNLLFNIGPDPRGELDARQEKALATFQHWLKANGEAIYGTSPEGIYTEKWNQGGPMHIGLITCKGRVGYLTIFNYPGAELIVSKIATPIESAEWLATGESLEVEPLSNHRQRISGLPLAPPDELPPVMKLTFAEPPKSHRFSGADWLEGQWNG